MSPIRVLIGDDHAVLRAGLKLLINSQSDMDVVGEAANGPEAVNRAAAIAPDVVLLDLSMPGGRFTETIEHIRRVAPASRVLVLTMHDDPAFMQAALRAGASGYVVKKAADVELLTAIRNIHQGRSVVNLTRPGDETSGHEIQHASRHSPAGGHLRLLSQREAEVLRLLARGHTNQEAADRLSLSVKTIESHRKRLSDKLGLTSRAQLFRFAVEIGLLEQGVAGPADT